MGIRSQEHYTVNRGDPAPENGVVPKKRNPGLVWMIKFEEMKGDSSPMSQETESDDNTTSESEEFEAEVEVPDNKMGSDNVTDYERQRMKRIEENRAIMEAMGLKQMAISFADSIPKPPKRNADKRGKRKVDEDEDYMPSSSGEEDEKNVEDLEEHSGGSSPKKKTKKSNKTPKKVSSGKHFDKSDFIDDDEALLQAIALSLEDSAGLQDMNFQESQSSNAFAVENSERKEKPHNQENTGKQKKKKMMNSRVQMTEDDLILYFFQLDEAGRGGITVRDVKKMAASHDFTWSDKEIVDMIKLFDSDADGKLNLDEFRKIATRCNMLRPS